MPHPSSTDFLEPLLRLCRAQDPQRARDTFAALIIALTYESNVARTAATNEPGGFAREQAWQVEKLNWLLDAVSTDVPDLEMERLAAAGDYDGILIRLQQLRQGRGVH